MKQEAGIEFCKQEAGTLGAGSSSSLMALPVTSGPDSDSPGGGSDVEAGNRAAPPVLVRTVAGLQLSAQPRSDAPGEEAHCEARAWQGEGRGEGRGEG
jgi:hypothetical protein